MQPSPQPTRILHIGKYYPPHPGGMETHLKNLVAHQSTHAQVEVLVANGKGPTASQHLDGALVTRLRTYGEIASMPVIPSLLTKLRGRQDDIVHLHMPNPGAAAALLLSGHRGKIVITHHGDTNGRETLRRLSDPFVRAIMARASAILVSSSRYLDSSKELQPFTAKCHVVPLGIELNKSTIDEELVASLRTRYGPRIVLAVGRLVPYKGFDVLIRSLRGVHATLLLIGTGPLLQALQSQARAADVDRRTHFLGYVDDPAPYFHAADVFVLPSVTRAESFGLVQLEAMAAGLPVINTDLASAVPEVSLHGVSGLTVPPGDASALTAALARLLDAPDLRAAFACAGRERTKLYTAQMNAERTDSVYRQVLSTR